LSQGEYSLFEKRKYLLVNKNTIALETVFLTHVGIGHHFDKILIFMMVQFTFLKLLD